MGGTTTRSISVGDFSADGDVNVAGINIAIIQRYHWLETAVRILVIQATYLQPLKWSTLQWI